MKQLTILGLLATIGCGVTDNELDSVALVGSNTLGVTQLEVARSGDGDERTFELRGIAATGEQRALVRLRTGAIEDLGGETGSELTLSIGDHTSRMVTRETQLFEIEPITTNAAAQQFLELDAISSTLARDANITVLRADAAEADDAALTSMTCPSAYLNVTPTAVQCCYYNVSSTWRTRFYNGSKIVLRKRNPNAGLGCKASDGVSACAGSTCYYGPNGFARPTLSDPPTPYWRNEPEPEVEYCVTMAWNTPQPAIYPNVTGTYATTQGCPGGGTGAGQWDY